MTEAEFQQIGERLTKALITGDFALYQTVMRLPLRTVPQGGKTYVLRTDDDLKVDFDHYHTAVKARQITDVYRKVLSIRVPEDDADTAVVLCEMNILQHSSRIVEPFESQFTLTRRNGDWRISEILSSLAHISWTLGQYLFTPDADFSPRSDDETQTEHTDNTQRRRR